MRRFAIVLVAVWLGGCAQLELLRDAYQYAESTTVTPQAILIASNAFNILEGTATNYFVYCRPRLVEPVCSADNRRKIIKAVRTGRAARTTLEGYFDKNASAPAVVYNTLINAIAVLRATPIAKVPQ